MHTLASRTPWPSAVPGAPLAAPLLSHHQLSDFCQKLQAGAVHGQHYAAAWMALGTLLQATSVQLLRDVSASAPVPPDAEPVHRLGPGAPPTALACVLPVADGDHGLLAIARVVPRGFDAVLVLRRSGPFNETERSWLELLLAHIRAALELGDQLSRPLPTVASAVQLARLVPMPCVLADGGGRCLERNQASCDALEALAGDVHAGRVLFDDTALQRAWREALMEGSLTAATQTVLWTSATGGPWKVHVVPFHCVSSVVHGVPQHLMFALFERLALADAAPRAVPALRPLTKAELAVLANLLLGQPAKTIARARGASVNTVRKQIATILEKTGHASQKELLASLHAGGPAERTASQ